MLKDDYVTPNIKNTKKKHNKKRYLASTHSYTVDYILQIFGAQPVLLQDFMITLLTNKRISNCGFLEQGLVQSNLIMTRSENDVLDGGHGCGTRYRVGLPWRGSPVRISAAS